jgi:hypothetical protein
MRVYLGERHVLTIRGRKEADNGITITCFVYFRFPQAFVARTSRLVHLLDLVDQFRGQRAEFGLFL